MVQNGIIFLQRFKNNMPECVAIKSNGNVCGRGLTAENQTTFCKTHQAVIHRKGPHTVAREELARVQRKELREFDAYYNQQWTIV